MTPDWSAISDKLIVMLLGGLGTWVLTSIRELRKDVDLVQQDMNAAFQKIRTLEKELVYDDAGTDANEQRD